MTGGLRAARYIWWIVACLWVTTIATAPVNAQTRITFGNGSSTGQVTFVANGNGTAALELGTCSSGTCTLSGNNLHGGTYSFTTRDSAGNIQVGGLIDGSGNRLVSMNGASTVFSYTSSRGDLTGTVVWNTATIGGAATLIGTLTITSSTIPGLSSKTATIEFTTRRYSRKLSTFIFSGAKGNTEGASLLDGAVVAPEPTSLLLFGTGLLAMGLRFRRRFSETNETNPRRNVPAR